MAKRRKKGLRETLKKNRKVIIAVAFILLLAYGFFLRVYMLGEESFWIDESISALAAKKIHEKGIPIFDSGVVYSRAYVFHYIMSGFLLFGYTESNARLISAVFGLLTCVLVYFIAREYDETVAWVAFILSIFLKVFVMYSRQARFYQFEMFFFFLTAYLLYRSFNDKRFLYYSIIPMIIAIDTHIEGYFLVPLALYALYVNKIRKRWIVLSAAFAVYMAYRLSGSLGWFNIGKVTAYLHISRYYIPFFFIALIGIAFTWKNRMTWILFGSSLIVLAASGLHTFFGYRYIYIVYLPAVVLAGVTFSKIRFNWLRWGMLLAYMVWVSNLVSPFGYGFVLKPQNMALTEYTAPGGDFRGAYEELSAIYDNETLIVTLGPEAEWYLKKPDYWLYTSYSGRDIPVNETGEFKRGSDRYTDAEGIFTLEKLMDVSKGSYVVIDDFGAARMPKDMLNYIVSNCNLKIEKTLVSVYWCSRLDFEFG